MPYTYLLDANWVKIINLEGPAIFCWLHNHHPFWKKPYTAYGKTSFSTKRIFFFSPELIPLKCHFSAEFTFQFKNILFHSKSIYFIKSVIIFTIHKFFSITGNHGGWLVRNVTLELFFDILLFHWYCGKCVNKTNRTNKNISQRFTMSSLEFSYKPCFLMYKTCKKNYKSNWFVSSLIFTEDIKLIRFNNLIYTRYCYIINIKQTLII